MKTLWVYGMRLRNALLKKQRELERKSKPTIKWLVKIEYHT